MTNPGRRRRAGNALLCKQRSKLLPTYYLPSVATAPWPVTGGVYSRVATRVGCYVQVCVSIDDVARFSLRYAKSTF
eukprot:scaffold28265_cov33-Attheya_sp.AAC.2